MSKLIAMAIPILPGKVDEWRSFVTELQGARNKDFVASRKRMKVRERTFYQHTPNIDLVVVTLEGENPEAAFAQFGAANDEFTKWFVDRVKAVHGFDLTQPPPGPPPELITDTGAL